MNTSEIYHFTDDSVIPNNNYPVLIYQKVFSLDLKLGKSEQGLLSYCK